MRKGVKKGIESMNKVILMGRLTRDPDIRYSQGVEPMCIARYTLAVDRKGARQGGDSAGQPTADFISCVAFGKAAEFSEKYLRQGMKIAVSGRIQTGSYTNRDGKKAYTTDVVIEEQEFAESKNAQTGGMSQAADTSGQPVRAAQQSMTDEEGFMQIPDGIDEELPFN